MRTVRGFEFPVDVVQHRLGAQDGGGVVGVLQFRVGEDVDGHVRFPATQVEESAESGGVRRRSRSGQTSDRKRKSNRRSLLRQVSTRVSSTVVRLFYARRTRTSFRRVGAQLSSYIGRFGKRSGYSGRFFFFGTAVPKGAERAFGSARIWSPLMMDGPS